MSDQRSLWKSTSKREMKMSDKSSGKKCNGHDGSAKVATLSRGIVVAGAQGAAINYGEADIVVDLAGGTRQAFKNAASTVLSGTEWLVSALASAVKHPDTLFVEWPDMGIPRVGPRFWRELYSVTPDKARVVFACVGGHGRTGTALACYIAASMKEVPDAVDLIRLVRRLHCGHAIEVKAQDDYIARVVAEFRAPGSKAEVDRQYALIDAAHGEREAAKAAARAAVEFTEKLKGTKEQEEAKVTTFEPGSPPHSMAAALVGPVVAAAQSGTFPRPWEEVEDAPEPPDEPEGGGDVVRQTEQAKRFFAALPKGAALFRDAAGSVVNAAGDVLLARSTMSEATYEWFKRTLLSWGEELERRALGKAGAN